MSVAGFPLIRAYRERRVWQALGVPRAIPWRLLEPHAKQAWSNHGQTLERLAQRGGLCPIEAVAVLEDRAYRTLSTEQHAVSVIQAARAAQ